MGAGILGVSEHEGPHYGPQRVVRLIGHPQEGSPVDRNSRTGL